MALSDYLPALSLPSAIALVYAGAKLRSEIEERNNKMALTIAKAADEDATDAREQARIAREEAEDLRAHNTRLSKQLRDAGMEPVP